MFNRRQFILTGGCISLGGCTLVNAPGAGLPILPATPASSYLLGPGDDLQIRIYDQPQLSGNYTIDDSGMVDLPLLGLVRAKGCTTDGLSLAVENSLKHKKLILNPSVAIEVSHYRPFYILGEVTTPGQYPYRPGMTILTAVSIAGGFTYRAVQTYAGITRDNGAGPAQYRAAIDALAQPGDVITVYERRF